MQRREKSENKSMKMMKWTESRCRLDMSTLSNLWIKFIIAKLIHYEINENGFFLSEFMRNVVIEDEFSVPTTINKKIYIH